MMKIKTCDKTCKINKMMKTDNTTKSTRIIVHVRTNFAEKLAF